MNTEQKLIIENQAKVKAVRELVKLCDNILDASLYWSGTDEEKNPMLRRIRTLAGYYQNEYKDYEIEAEPTYILPTQNPISTLFDYLPAYDELI